jgi:hypothetical protein
MFIRRAILTATLASFAVIAAPRNMGGSWKLNLDKSKWGKRGKPTCEIIDIEENGPAIKYHGTIINADGSDVRKFAFDGAIDGKPYSAEGPDGAGTMTINQVNDDVTRWTYRSGDGKVTEEAVTSLSRDGKELTRRVHRKGPKGDFAWTEIYDKTK